MELHQYADEKSQTDLLSALRFLDSRNKIEKQPPIYILTWIKLLGNWPSIVKRGCRFALQARFKFIDQVRILAKTKILWNHGRVLLCPTLGEIYYSTFGVNLDQFQDAIRTEPCCNLRGLKIPGSILVDMLKVNSRTVQVATIAKFCATTGRGQRFAILGESREDNRVPREDAEGC